MTARQADWLRSTLGLALLCAAVGLPAPGALFGQQRIPPVDSLRADTTVRGEPRGPKAYPELLESTDRIFASTECDRECLLSTPATSLLALVEHLVPGATPLRSGYFGGPHHLLTGPAGPGFVQVVLDGRRLAPLESGQVDLARISLISLERVRVEQRADGLVVDLRSHRHDTPVAYSRITAGTGDPGLQLLRGIFSNGLGRDLVVEGWFDLLDTNEADLDNDLTEFRGRLGWVPGGGRVGIEFEYGNQDVVRSAADTTDFDRREILVRARGELGPGLQAELRLGTEQFRFRPEPDEPTPDTAVVVRDVKQMAVALRARRGPATGRAEARLLDGAGHPSFVGLLSASYLPAPSTGVQASLEVGSWEGFTSRELRVGASLRLPIAVPVVARADVASGKAGVVRPVAGTADSVSFDAVSFGAETELGPYRLSGRYVFQKLARQLPFGDAFDRLAGAGPKAGIGGWELRAAGPVIPLGALVSGLAPIRGEGSWRRQEEEPGILYLPRNLLRGRLLLHDSFFADELEIWLGADVTRRDAVLSFGTAATEATLLPSYTWVGADFAFRIGTFRFWWRIENPAGLSAADVPGLSLPTRVNVVGVKWEFRD